MTSQHRRFHRLADRRLALASAGVIASAAAAAIVPARAQTQPAPAAAATANAGYFANFAALRGALQQVASDFGERCDLGALTSSGEGREVFLLTLAADQRAASSKPALLVVAGLDARHRVGVETAVRFARRILAEHADLLDDITIYVVPCANPDGYERNLGGVNFGHIGNVRAVDDDRDGAADEDGPQDLNGDGAITMMRRIDPPLDDWGAATHLPDPVEPRLLKRADPARGERAVYALYVEGLDADGDGAIAEDGVAGVDLERNFLHRYPEHERSAGHMPLSERETLALADFVIERRNIFAAIVYGRHDNLINVPDGRGSDISGQAPRDLDPGDVEYFKEMSRVYKETTAQERAASGLDTAGALHAWLYAQRGLPSFAVNVWGRPEVKEARDRGAAGEGQADPPPTPLPPPLREGEGAPPTSAPAGEDAKPQAAEGRGGRAGGAGGGAGGGGGRDEKKPEDAEGAAWLKYSDAVRDGEGFMPWTPFDHPTLGRVEIGGFVPGFQMNPPAGELDALAQTQTDFALEVIDRRPRLSVQGPNLTKLADGLYEVRLGIVNEGYLPTANAIARKARSMMPTVVRISTDLDRIVAGERVNRTWGIGGSGDRSTYRWIVRAEAGSEIAIEINNPHLGNQRLVVRPE